MNALEQELEEVNTRFIGYWKSGDKKNIESVYSDKIRLCTEFRNFMSGKGGSRNNSPPLGYEKVYLPLCKVADTPFHIQVADTPFHIQGDELLCD